MIGNAAAAAPDLRRRVGMVASDTWLLLSLRWLIMFNSFRARKVYQQVLIGLLVLAVAGSVAVTSGAVGFGAGALLNRFRNVELEPLLPGLMLTGGTFLLLLSSFGAALSSLFLSSDLELLMSAPVDRKAVFISKILDSIGLNYAVVLVTAVPALFTYGLGLGYGPLYYVLALLAALGMPLLPAGLGSMLVIIVARFAPARRVREVLGLVAALVGVGCSLLGQTSRFWIRGLSGREDDLGELVRSLEGLAALPIPSMIAGRGLAAAGANDVPAALIGLAGFLLLTFGFFAGCVWLADNMYAAGWVRMQSSGASRRSRERAAREAARSGLLGRAPAYLAIALKDWRVIPRDLRNFAQLLWPLGVLPVLYINVVAGGRSGVSPDIGQVGWEGINLGGALIAAGILTTSIMLFSQIGSNAISMEGKSWWLLKAAPISGAELLLGKVAGVMIPFSIASTILLVIAGIWQELGLLGLIYGWLGIQVLGAAVLVIAVCLGVPWARLDWDDPRRMSSGIGSGIAFVLDIVLAVVGGGLLFLPLVVEVFWPAWALPAFIGGLLGAVGVSALMSYLALQLALNRLSTVGGE